MFGKRKRNYLFKLVIIVILLVCSSSVFAETLKDNRPPNNQTTNHIKTPSEEQRGGEESPLFVKILNPPNLEASTEKQEEERKEDSIKSENERLLTLYTGKLAIDTHNLAVYTGSLAVFTMLIFLIAGIQAWFFWKQLGLMKEGAKDTRDAAEAAKVSSIAAMGSERAYIWPTLPNIGDLIPTTAEKMYKDPPSNRIPSLKCAFGNFGKTPGIIKEIVGIVILGKTLPDALPDTSGAGHTYTTHQICVPETKTDALEFKYSRGLTHAENGALVNGEINFYFYGHINFIDVFGYEIQEGFCFRITIGENAFIGVDGDSRFNYRKIREKSEK